MILAEEKMRHCDRELQTGFSSGTYNLDRQEVCGGEELEKIAVSRKPIREISCSSNVRTNLVPDDDRIIMRRVLHSVFMALRGVFMTSRLRDQDYGTLDTAPGYMPILEYRWYGSAGTCKPSGCTVIAFQENSAITTDAIHDDE